MKSEPIAHPGLGVLNKSGSGWNGSFVVLHFGEVQLQLSGNKKGPDDEAVRLALEMPEKSESLRLILAQALFEHYEPYREADDVNHAQDRAEAFPHIQDANRVWQHVKLEQVRIEPLLGVMTVEFDYSVSWDDDHTLGARFQNWQFVELCGSV